MRAGNADRYYRRHAASADRRVGRRTCAQLSPLHSVTTLLEKDTLRGAEAARRAVAGRAIGRRAVASSMKTSLTWTGGVSDRGVSADTRESTGHGGGERRVNAGQRLEQPLSVSQR